MESKEGTSTQEDPPGPTWSTLPVEIKVHILRQRLIIAGPITFKSHPSHSRRCLLPLMLTNKDTMNLAREVYYGDNKFILSNDPGSTQDGEHLRYPHPAHGPWVRKLELRIHAHGMPSPRHYCMRSEKDPERYLAWPPELKCSLLLQYLIEPREEAMRKEHKRGYLCKGHGRGNKRWSCGHAARSAEWQNHFDDVRDLKIVVLGTPCFTEKKGKLPGSQTPEALINRLSSKIRIPIGARRVEIVAEDDEQWWSSWDSNCCKGLCPGILQSLVRGLVEIRTADEENKSIAG